MREFNLEEAKAGKPVRTRDGREARIICFDAKFGDTPKSIIALVKKENGNEEITEYTNKGRMTLSLKGDEESALDLVMDTRQVKYMIVYKNGSEYLNGTLYNTMVEAMDHLLIKSDAQVCAVAKVEWEE